MTTITMLPCPFLAKPYPGALRGGSRGYLRYRARIFQGGGRNFGNSVRYICTKMKNF